MEDRINDLLARIEVLERELEHIQQHHQHCSIVAPVSPPSDNETENINSSTGGSLQIILECPEKAGPPEPRKPIQKWQKIADQLLEDLPSPEERPARESDYIIAHLCGGSTQPPAQIYKQDSIAQAGEIFAYTINYAKITKAARENVTRLHQLQTFRELVFVSLCAVLEDLDYPPQEINKAMREWLSDSSDFNLNRLRKGAVWANHTIANLEVGKATEWIFNHAITVSQYGILSSSESKSTPYIATGFLKQNASLPVVLSSHEGLPESRTQFEDKVDGGWTPLCIPAFIKIISRGVLTLSQIRSSLGYHRDLETMTRLCDTYESICRPVSGPPSDEPQQGMKRKHMFNEGPNMKKRIDHIRTEIRHQGHLQPDPTTQTGEIDPTVVPGGGSHQSIPIPSVESSPQSDDRVNGRGASAEAKAPGGNNSMQVLVQAVQHMAASPGRDPLDVDSMITQKDPPLEEPWLYFAGWEDFVDLQGEPRLYGNGWGNWQSFDDSWNNYA